jgi:phosphoglycolate phosphatase
MDGGIRRLILWDVDGTLLTGGSVSREVFAAAVTEVTGVPAGDHAIHMSGKTDPQIALEIMADVGVPSGPARDALPAVLEALERGLATGVDRIRSEGRAHPGVLRLLERLHGEPGVIQSVLTGNLRGNAIVKVSAFGLERFLDLDVGAYGSDHHDRDELIAVALARVGARYGRRLDPRQAWVVGDTPKDLACARAGGARCILVATGRYVRHVLELLGADAVLADLSDTEAVIDLVLGP